MKNRFLLVCIALVAFGGSLFSSFHFDDYAIFGGQSEPGNVKNLGDPGSAGQVSSLNITLGSPAGWREIWSLRQTRPLTLLTFWINRQLGGADPIGYHAVNLALHLTAVLLLYECLRRLISPRAAVCAAAIFAVHPIQAEAVDYIWGRSIVLAATLCFAALLAWITGRRWAAVACFAAALLAKEEVAAFPLLLALVEFRSGRGFSRAETAKAAAALVPAGSLPRPRNPSSRSQKRAIASPENLGLALMFLLSLAAGLRVVYTAAVTPASAAGTQAGISPWHYLLAQGPVIWRYLRLLVIPYGFTVDPEIAMPPLWAGLAAWTALAALVCLAWRRHREWGFWLAAGFLLLIPSSTIFPAADLSADRRLYFPMLGFAAAAGLALARLRPKAAAALLVAALIAGAFARTEVWMTEQSLWREAVQRAPRKIRPKIQLARQLPSAEALQLLVEARKLAPQDPAIAAETGRVLLTAGHPAEALAEFGRALALDPRDARNYNNRGVALEALGQTEAARQDFTRALALDPALPTARENLLQVKSPANLP